MAFEKPTYIYSTQFSETNFKYKTFNSCEKTEDLE